MPLNRRRVLYSLACATGFPAAGWGAAAAASSADDAGLPAERVTGIGGLFFRAKDPKALALWYRNNLGIATTPMSKDDKPWHTDAGTTAFTPFSMTSKYLGDEHQMFMVNFRVRDLEKMAAQLRAAGVEVKVDPEHYPYGRFAKLQDPEGNPIELWEPVEAK